MTLPDFISNNIAPIAGLLYLLIALRNSATISPWEKKLFHWLWALELLELIAYNAELVTAAWDHPTTLRILLSAVGYSLRPALLYILIRLICEKSCEGWRRVVLTIPMVLAVIFAFSAFFTDIVYSYDAANQFHRGPLGYSLHILLVVYVIMFTALVLRRKVLEKRMEWKIMLLAAAYVILTMVAEAVFLLRGIGRTAIVLSTIFFLSALQTTKLKRTIQAQQENEDLKSALAKVEAAQRELMFNKSIMQALGEDYLTVLYADLDRNEIRMEKIEPGYDFAAVLGADQSNTNYDSVIAIYTHLFVVPEEQERFLSQFRREALLKTLTERKSFTVRYNCHLDDSPVFCVESHVIRTEQSLSPNGIIIGLRNVEEQVQKEREQMAAMTRALESARQANAAKSAFLARMSHDIRTPLNGIIGILEIEELHKNDTELLNRNREKAKIAANHLLSLINDVLDMSKLEDGTTELARETIFIPQLVDDVTTLVEMRAAEAGITLCCDSEHNACTYPFVYGSPLHLRQIFLNILSNAIKYNKPGGSIHTLLECLGLEGSLVTYRVTISDTGIGMSPEFLPHIFEPFTQEHSDARSVYQGTGLGMAIVKGLVDRMGGTIAVSSQLGMGSAFVVTLPFEISSESALSSEETENTPADIHGVRILLAEDNELNMEIATTLLEEAGARITPVTDGQAAVDAFANNPPDTFDLILMDIMMPVMDGLTASRTIRAMQRPDAARIPIVAMTANAFVEDEKAALAAGMNAHVAKPLDLPKLIATISRLTRRKT